MQFTDTASAGNGGVATASANGGAVAIGDVNSGGNAGNAIGVGDTWGGSVAVDGGSVGNSTHMDPASCRIHVFRAAERLTQRWQSTQSGQLEQPHPIRRPCLTDDEFLRASTWAREQPGAPSPAYGAPTTKSEAVRFPKRR